MIQSEPIISVVIPVFNRQEIVKNTLNSITDQTYRPFNVILVDNASTDNTLKILYEWKQSVENSVVGKGLNIKIISCNKPGASAARNTGLNLVTTPWVMFFDSDDTMSHSHIDSAIKDIIYNPLADIIGWNTLFINNEGHRLRLSKFHTNDVLWYNIFNGNLSTQHYCARTSLIRKTGGWNESIGYWDDIELGTRILSHNPNIIKSKYNKNRVIIHVSENSITGKPNENPDRIKPALNSINSIIENKKWILLKQVIEAAICSKAKSYHGLRIYKESLNQCNTNTLRLMLRFAYNYTLRGGRGIALIYRKLGLF